MARIIEISNPFEPWKVSRQYDHPGGVTIRGWLEETYPDFKEFAKPTYCVVNGQPMLRAQWLVYKIKPGDVVGFVVTPGDPVTWLYILYAVLVIATIAIALSLPKPGTPTDAQADTVYFLKGQRNQNRLSNPIEVPYGRCRLFPSYAARPWNNYSGNQQYQYSLYCLGQGEYDIHSIQYEDTPIGDFDDIEYEIYGPGTPATLFPDNVVTSSEVANIELFGTNEPEYVIAGPFTANEAGTLTDLLQVDIALPLGLYYGNDDGSLGNFTVHALFEYREIDDAGDPVGAGTWLTLSDFTVTRKTATPQRFTVEKSVPPGRYQVRGLRIGDHDQRARISNTVVWDGLRAFLPSVQNYPNVTLIAVKAKATNGLNDGTSQRFNVWATRKLRTYDIGTETWSAPVATRNPIWAFCDTFQASYGGQLEDRFLALDELCALAATFTSEGRNFDFVFDTKSTVWDTATIIARVVRARPMMNGSQVTMIRDVPKSIVTAVFTPFNICKGSFKWEIKMAQVGDYDGVEIEYIDPVTWKPETVKCLIADDAGDDLEQIKLAGCTDREFAAQEGFYIRRCRRLLRENITFQTELEGHLPSYGDLIRVVHDLPRWGTAGLVRSISGTTVVLSEPVTFTTGNVIGFRKKDGSESGPHACTAGADPYTIILGAPLADSFYFDGKHELPMFAFGVVNDSGALCTVVGLTPDDDNKVTVKAVVYNAAIFDGGVTPEPVDNGVPNTPTIPTLNCASLNAGRHPTDPTKVVLSWSPSVGSYAYVVEISNDGVTWETVIASTPTPYANVTWSLPGTLHYRITALGVGLANSAPCVGTFTPPTDTAPIVYYDDIPTPYYGGTLSASYRQVGGTWHLIGYPEWNDFSAPRRYLRVTYAGTKYVDVFPTWYDYTCIAYGYTRVYAYSGAAVIDKVTGLLVSQGNIHHNWPTPGDSSIDNYIDYGGAVFTSVMTPTVQTVTGDEICYAEGDGYLYMPAHSMRPYGVATATLSDRDTKENAVNRAAPIGDLEAEDWVPCGGHPCATSKLTGEGDVLSGEYTRAQYREEGVGFIPNTLFTATVYFFRENLTTHALSYFELEYNVTSNDDGELELIITLPEEAGYEIHVLKASTYKYVEVLSDPDEID